jgi:hypothetical protein
MADRASDDALLKRICERLLRRLSEGLRHDGQCPNTDDCLQATAVEAHRRHPLAVIGAIAIDESREADHDSRAPLPPAIARPKSRVAILRSLAPSNKAPPIYLAARAASIARRRSRLSFGQYRSRS